MIPRVRRVLSAIALSLPLAGCLSLEAFDTAELDGVTPIVPSGSFASSAGLPAPVKANYAAAPTPTFQRVERVAHEILAANPEIGVRPRFAAIGSPHAEIFRQGSQIIYVTEGLEKQCKNDPQLAALLCLELGKMVAEREPGSLKQGHPNARPPLEVVVGNAASQRAVDLTALAERAKHEHEQKQAAKRRIAPDPTALAETYLQNAGYSKHELESVAPLLLKVEKNYLIEKQLNGPPGGTGWRPVAPPS